MVGHWCIHVHPELQARIRSEGWNAGQWAARQWLNEMEEQRRLLRVDSSLARDVPSFDKRVETALGQFLADDFIAECCTQWARAIFLMAAEVFRPCLTR